MTTLFNWSSHGGQNEDRTLLQRSQCCHNGDFRHISISTWRRSLQSGQNLRGPFLRATLLMRVGSCARAMADNEKTKGLITPPSRWVSAQLLYVCFTADSDHEGVVRICVALSCELGGFFILYCIILYYAAQFFPYQEYNIVFTSFGSQVEDFATNVTQREGNFYGFTKETVDSLLLTLLPPAGHKYKRIPLKQDNFGEDMDIKVLLLKCLLDALRENAGFQIPKVCTGWPSF